MDQTWYEGDPLKAARPSDAITTSIFLKNVCILSGFFMAAKPLLNTFKRQELHKFF